MISIDRVKEMALEDIENNPEKHLEEYAELLQQLDQLQAENEELKKEVELLKQYKGSKQASYESMQIEWNKAVSRSRDLLKQVEDWQEKYNQLKAAKEQAEQKLERIRAMFKESNNNSDEFYINGFVDETLQIIDEVE